MTINANTQVTRAIFAALDEFEDEIKGFGMKADRTLYAAEMRGQGWMAAGSMKEKPRRCLSYDVSLYSKELPVKGNAALIDALEKNGLHVVKRRRGKTGPLSFCICKHVAICEEMGAGAA